MMAGEGDAPSVKGAEPNPLLILKSFKIGKGEVMKNQRFPFSFYRSLQYLQLSKTNQGYPAIKVNYFKVNSG